jgi:hypothetical protein
MSNESDAPKDQADLDKIANALLGTAQDALLGALENGRRGVKAAVLGGAIKGAGPLVELVDAGVDELRALAGGRKDK